MSLFLIILGCILVGIAVMFVGMCLVGYAMGAHVANIVSTRDVE